MLKIYFFDFATKPLSEIVTSIRIAVNVIKFSVTIVYMGYAGKLFLYQLCLEIASKFNLV